MSTSKANPSVNVNHNKAKLNTGSNNQLRLVLVLLGMMLLASNMRAPIVALGALAPNVQAALSITNIQIGWLGTIPVIMFAIGAFVSPYLSKRLGIETLLIYTVFLLTFGMLLRVSVVSWWIFALGTMLLSLAIGFANTLAAPAIKFFTPNHIPLVTGALGLTISIMAGIAAGTAMPMSKMVGWQWTLGSWALFSLVSLIIWIVIKFVIKPTHQETHIQQQTTDSLPMWRTPRAWYLAVFMGMQSLLFYTFASFLPSILIDKGMTDVLAGQMVSIFLFMAPVSIVVLTWLVRYRWLMTTLAIASAAGNFIGVFGVTYLSLDFAWLWLASAGFGGTMLFTLCSMLISMRTYDTEQASNLSGMAQTIGYMIAIFGPIGSGWLHQVTHSWSLPLNILCVLMFVNIGFGWLVSRPVMIDGGKLV